MTGLNNTGSSGPSRSRESGCVSLSLSLEPSRERIKPTDDDDDDDDEGLGASEGSREAPAGGGFVGRTEGMGTGLDDLTGALDFC